MSSGESCLKWAVKFDRTGQNIVVVFQVLIGHTDTVTCVAVSVSDKSQVISGSCDNNLIVWDINTGADLFTLSGHLSYVTCVKLSGDGTIAVSGCVYVICVFQLNRTVLFQAPTTKAL